MSCSYPANLLGGVPIGFDFLQSGGLESKPNIPHLLRMQMDE
jgi:hypothetical protein